MTRKSARAHVLGAIKEHLAVAHAAEPPPGDREAASHKIGRPELPDDIAGRVARFKSVLESVGGHVTVATDMAQAASALQHIVATRAIRRLAVSDDDDVTSMVASLTQVEIVDAHDRDVLLNSDAGLSGAQWGVAETGSLVLSSGNERHRIVSLLPPVHVALLRATRILGGLDDALGRFAREEPQALPRVVTFVTGPSRTADIELTLVVGVHGPKELHVIVLQEDLA